jgi:hypothetical protein
VCAAAAAAAEGAALVAATDAWGIGLILLAAASFGQWAGGTRVGQVRANRPPLPQPPSSTVVQNVAAYKTKKH